MITHVQLRQEKDSLAAFCRDFDAQLAAIQGRVRTLNDDRAASARSVWTIVFNSVALVA